MTTINRMWHQVSSPLHASPASQNRPLSPLGRLLILQPFLRFVKRRIDGGMGHRRPDRGIGTCPPLPGWSREYHVALRICFWQDLRLRKQTHQIQAIKPERSETKKQNVHVCICLLSWEIETYPKQAQALCRFSECALYLLALHLVSHPFCSLCQWNKSFRHFYLVVMENWTPHSRR